MSVNAGRQLPGRGVYLIRVGEDGGAIILFLGAAFMLAGVLLTSLLIYRHRRQYPEI